MRWEVELEGKGKERDIEEGEAFGNCRLEGEGVEKGKQIVLDSKWEESGGRTGRRMGEDRFGVEEGNDRNRLREEEGEEVRIWEESKRRME